MASELPPAAERMPLELILHVVEAIDRPISSSTGDHRPALALLHAFCLTCRELRVVAQPLLWRSPCVRGSAQLAALARACEANPTLAAGVRVASLGGDEDGQGPAPPTLATVLRTIPQVKALELTGLGVLDLAVLRPCQSAQARSGQPWSSITDFLVPPGLECLCVSSCFPVTTGTVGDPVLPSLLRLVLQYVVLDVRGASAWLNCTTLPALEELDLLKSVTKSARLAHVVAGFGPDLNYTRSPDGNDDWEDSDTDDITLDVLRANQPLPPPTRRPGWLASSVPVRVRLRLVDVHGDPDPFGVITTALPRLAGRDLLVPRALRSENSALREPRCMARPRRGRASRERAADPL